MGGHPSTTHRLGFKLFVGLVGGAAVGVLISVAVGPLPGGPFLLPAVTAVVGAGAARYSRFHPPDWVVVIAVAAWTAIVLLASIFVIAAIGLSRFE